MHIRIYLQKINNDRVIIKYILKAIYNRLYHTSGFSILTKVLQVLLYRIHRLVNLVHSILQILRGLVRHGGTKKSLKKFSHEFPCTSRNYARSVLDLDEDTLEILIHRDATKLHAKVSDLEPWTLRLDLRLLLVCVDTRDLEHQKIEKTVGDEWHHFVARLEKSEDRSRLFRVVKNMDRPLYTQLRHRHVRLAIDEELSRLYSTQSDYPLRQELDGLRPRPVFRHRELLQDRHSHFLQSLQELR